MRMNTMPNIMESNTEKLSNENQLIHISVGAIHELPFINQIETIYYINGDLSDIADDYGRLRPITADYDRLSIEEKKILLYLIDNERTSKKEAMGLINAKETKTKEVLKSLVDKKLIERKGKGRSTYYVLKNKGRNIGDEG